MRTLTKIVLTIIALIITIPIFVITKETPILKLAIIAGLVAGVRAIWKYNPDKKVITKSEGLINHQLDKGE